MLSGFGTDIRCAWRSQWRRPGFTALAVLTLAVGIGANTTVFSMANQVLYRPLPGVSDTERAVFVEMVDREGRRRGGGGLSPPNFEDVREAATLFEALSGFGGAVVYVAVGEGRPVELRAHTIRGEYFEALGVTDGLLPILGIQAPRLGVLALTLFSLTVAWGFQRYGYSVLAPGVFASEILATLPEGVALLHLDGNVRFANAGMERLAACPNMVAKLSGLGTFIHRNDPAHIAAIVRETVALFGAERALFGSNFPIEKLWTDYASLISAHRAALGELPDEAQADVFHNVAARVYRLS